MKKSLFLFVATSLSATIFLISGCTKDDTTPPEIILNGSDNIEISLNSNFTDPGATANDDEDGEVIVTSDFSSSNPNVNLVGTYLITYSAQDASGNFSTATLTVRVKNDAENFAGTYSVHDRAPGYEDTYPQVITVDSTVNNRVHFNKFANYANNSGIYASKLSNGRLEIPTQDALNIGSGTGSCSIADHRFSSSSYADTTGGFVINYTDAITNPASCIGSLSGTMTFTR